MPLHASLRPSRRLVALSLLVAAAACGGGDDATTDSAAAASDAGDTAAVATAAPAAAAAEAELGTADIDAYERGLAAEVEVLRQAVERRASARTGEDTLSAMMAATDMQSVPAAAERAGLDVERYRRLENEFGTVLSKRAMNPAMLAQVTDTSQLALLPAEAQERARANIRESAAAFSDSATYSTLPPALHDTFRQRADARLDALWKERNELRARAAGLGG